MRPLSSAVLLGFLVLFLTGWSNAGAACAVYTPMYHSFDSYLLCDDTLRPTGYAYQQSDPAGVNTDSVRILCEAADGVRCNLPASGVSGDGRVTIETDWSGLGVIGCPSEP